LREFRLGNSDVAGEFAGREPDWNGSVTFSSCAWARSQIFQARPTQFNLHIPLVHDMF